MLSVKMVRYRKVKAASFPILRHNGGPLFRVGLFVIFLAIFQRTYEVGQKSFVLM